MRRIISLSGLLLTVLLLASCNLFIDDDYVNEEGFKNVPVHEGNGYDAPVTVQDDSCVVTYQLKRDVRVLSKDDAERYVSQVKYDDLGAFIEIHFIHDTPRDLLPVDGEILMTTVSEHFKWGACHRIQYHVDQDGVYKYIATFTNLNESFEDLQIKGAMTFDQDVEFYSAATINPVSSDDEVEESAEAGARTRADEEQMEFDEEGVHVLLNGSHSELRFPLSFSLEGDYGNVHGSLTLPAEGNTYSIENSLNFTEFSLKDGNMKISMTQTIEENTMIVISGGFHYNKTIFSVMPVAIPITIGPVVILFFVQLDLNLNVDLQITATFSKTKITKYDYDIDLWEKTIVKKINSVKDTGWRFSELEESVEVSLSLDISIGLGIFGKVITVKFIITPALSFSVGPPKLIQNSLSYYVADLTDKPGPQLSLTLSLKLGVSLDLSLKDLVGRFQELGDEADKLMLEELEQSAKEKSEYYKYVSEKNFKEYNKSNPDAKGIGAFIPFGPFTIGSINLGTWYPELDDASLKVHKTWNPDYSEMTFVGEYAIKEKGIFASMFGKKYIPALCMMRRGKVVDYFFSEEAGMNSPITTVKAYHFYLPPMDDDKTYTVSPCYFLKGNLKSPVAIDKSLAYNASSPHAEIAMVKPVAVKRVVHTDRFAGDPKYTYTFEFDTYTDIKGMVYMSNWGISEIFTALKHPYKRSTDKKVKDGTYLMHWKVSVNTDSERTSIVMALRPYFSVQQSDMTGEIVSFAMDSDKTYSITIDGNTQEGTF